MKRKKPLDMHGQAQPWFTYGFMAFLKERINDGMSVFEFGSGNSTLWFSKYGCKLVSVEHDLAWFNAMKDQLVSHPNVEYLHRDLENGTYAKEITNYSGIFDIIVLDGRDRVNCCLNSLGALKEKGVVIWDNSDREEYAEGYQFLKSNDFKRIDFHGLGPINSRAWCTSIFYREENCLNI